MNSPTLARREFLSRLGVTPLLLPFLEGLPGLAGEERVRQKQRLIIVFSPNGVVPKAFWPEEEGENFILKEILTPLEPYRERLLILHGLSNLVRGDGDSHMRGMGCLLTGKELLPGNVQGGSDTPAGWASGISIDQEIKNHLQVAEKTRTRFGSLEFGVAVPDRADPWTRLCYAGGNRPIAPISDPYQMFKRLYGRMQDQGDLQSVLDDVQEDLKRVSARLGREDQRRLAEHAAFVRQMELDLQQAAEEKVVHATPELDAGVLIANDSIPTISRMQIDLLVNSLVNDLARVATLQYTNSVGQARMSWLGIEEKHHTLSHEPQTNEDAQEKLVRINQWFCGELAYLTDKLAQTPEPGGDGSVLDHTLIVWTNELGRGNSHTLHNIPFVLLGNGYGFRMGRALRYQKVAHNRLLLSLTQASGHPLETFGNPELCAGGSLDLS